MDSRRPAKANFWNEINQPESNKVAAPTETETTPKTIAKNNAEIPKKKNQSDRVSKALRETVQLFNRYWLLKDKETEVSPHMSTGGRTSDHSPQKKGRRLSHVTPP